MTLGGRERGALGSGRAVGDGEGAALRQRHDDGAQRGGQEAGPEHVGGERPSRDPQAIDEDKVGRVALRDGDRGAVGDSDHPEQERREWRRVTAGEHEHQRHHQYHGPVQGHRGGQARAERAHRRVQRQAAAARAHRQLRCGPLRQPRPLHERGERQRRGQESHERDGDGERRGDPRAKRDVDARGHREQERAQRAVGSPAERSDPDDCDNGAWDKHP